MPAIRMTPTDPSWAKWIQHLRAGKSAELADDAEAFGNLIVSKRWPGEDTPLPTVDKRARSAKTPADSGGTL